MTDPERWLRQRAGEPVFNEKHIISFMNAFFKYEIRFFTEILQEIVRFSHKTPCMYIEYNLNANGFAWPRQQEGD